MRSHRSVDESRRRFLKLSAGVPLVAGLGPLASASPVQALPRRSVGGSPIVKPLPPEWFVDYGTNAEMRWDAAYDLGYRVPNERFFVRDHGRHWRPARRRGPNRRNGWVRWELPWRPTSTGNHTLLARAVDESGRRQPDSVPVNDGGYLFWAIVRHPVTVHGR